MVDPAVIAKTSDDRNSNTPTLPILHTPQGSVLVAEDDEVQRLALVRMLRGENFAVEAVSNGEQATAAFKKGKFDLVVSDIDMPGRGGIELLQVIRQHDLEIPVILLTGSPTLDTAILAIEHRATRYLKKPIDHGLFRDVARRSMQASRLAHVRKKLSEPAPEADEHELLEQRFERALAQLHMVYQPIVRWSECAVFAHEALMRSREPGLAHPGALLDAAETLDRVQDLGRMVRLLSAEPLCDGDERLLFVNLHTKDLADEVLYDVRTPLAAVASRVVLEITERAQLDSVCDVSGRIKRLREMGYRIALDDLGAGYAALTSFASLEPDYVKLDMSLVRGIHESKTKQRLVGSMIEVCLDLGIDVIGEGIEQEAERDTLLALGCDLLQGYLFARPASVLLTQAF